MLLRAFPYYIIAYYVAHIIHRIPSMLDREAIQDILHAVYNEEDR